MATSWLYLRNFIRLRCKIERSVLKRCLYVDHTHTHRRCIRTCSTPPSASLSWSIPQTERRDSRWSAKREERIKDERVHPTIWIEGQHYARICDFESTSGICFSWLCLLLDLCIPYALCFFLSFSLVLSIFFSIFFPFFTVFPCLGNSFTKSA